ncbi:MAG: tyrosine-protein phosphatase [Ilumatobacteraceae bacterium]|nr:MAG: tyrosine-protein phosphatase [Actinomycetota bacterium]
MSRRVARTRMLAVSLAVVLAAGGCGGDDEGAPDTDAPSSTDATKPPDTAAPSTEAPSTEAPAAALAAELVVDPSVTRDESGRLVLQWSAAPGSSVDEITWGTDPDDIADPLDVELTPDTTEVVVDDPAPGQRVYFSLASSEGPARTVAERRVPLVGAPNFRDLGGYVTEDGRTVRWGQIFRSGELSELTDADAAMVDLLGIRLVCDLRSPAEIAEDVDRVPTGAEVATISIFSEGTDAVVIREAVIAGDVSMLGAPGELLTEAGRGFVTDKAPEYTQLMQRLMDPANHPTNLHCTAGKDRAGLGSALVLLTLGVPEETVMKDYLLSNEFLAAKNAETMESLAAILDPSGLEVVQSLIEVRPEYLQASFDAMKDTFGSIDAYLEEGLGITPEARAEFQQLMLE